MYTFASDTQYIFNVFIGGRLRMVTFEPQNSFGRSLYRTDDRDIANAIRKQRPFLMGAIQEVVEETPKTIETTEDNDSILSPTPESQLKEMTFNNFSQAKDYVSKTFGVAKTQLKKPETVEAIARENGIHIVYVEE